MDQPNHNLMYRLRFLFGGAYILIAIMAIVGTAAFMSDGRPIVLSTDYTIDTAAIRSAINANTAAAIESFHNGLRTTGHGVSVGIHGVGLGLTYVGYSFARSLIFVVCLPAKAVASVADAPLVSSAIRPGSNGPVPVIQAAGVRPGAPQASLAAVTPAAPAAPVLPSTIWPIHGRITTPFGVPEPPYEPIHTGLDITDGQRPGVTPVKAFRAGRVISVIHGGGLGNHVIVDHGGGLTSVYGHLASTSVSVGQLVDTTTTIGLEGSTGMSTGTHLHFETWQNGVALDPHHFIAGQPY